MAELSLFEQIKSMISGAGDLGTPGDQQAKAESARATRRAVSEEASFIAGLQSKIDGILTGKKQVLGGKIQLVGLSRIRDHFGDDWPRVIDRVHEIARAEFRRQTSQTDVVIPYGDLSYLIIFSNLDEAASKMKCIAIGEEIARKLIGEGMAKELCVVKSASFGVEGTIDFADVDREGLVELVKKSAEGVGEQLPPLPERPPALDANQRIAARDATLGQIKFVFRPMWDVAREAISTYLIVPTLKDAYGRELQGAQLWGQTAGWMEPAEFDAFVIRYAINVMESAYRSGRRMLLAVSLRYGSLATSKDRKLLLESLNAIPEARRPHFIFDIEGIAEGIPQGRMIEIAYTLRPYCRFVFATVPLDWRTFDVFANAGLKGVSANLTEFRAAESTLLRHLSTFAERASKCRLGTALRGVRSRSVAMAAICDGFSFLDGDAISDIGTAPGYMVKFELADLYASSKSAA